MFVKQLIAICMILLLAGCATTTTGQRLEPQQPQSSEGLSQQELQPSNEQMSEAAPELQPQQYTAPQTLSEQKKHRKDSAQMRLSGKQIQRALKNADFYKGSVDGKIGPKTKQAIKDFQKANGLKADGLVGRRTIEKLSKYLQRLEK